MRDPSWVRIIDDMCVGDAAMLLAHMDHNEVCSTARVEIVAKLLIAHTDILGDAARLSDVIARAQSLMTQRVQGAH